MPKRFKIPCLDCGVLTDGDSRCAEHQAKWLESRKKVDTPERKAIKRERYNKNYQRIAKRIRQLAIANATECYLCGVQLRIGDDVQVDHLEPALGSSSPLAPTHASCNRRKGNKSAKDL